MSDAAQKDPVEVRTASDQDAPAMAELINEIIEVGGTTAYRAPFSAERIVQTFIRPPRLLACHVAESAGRLLGFQNLEWADPDWPGPERRPAEWTFIATYVARAAHGRGVGRALFDANRAVAASAGSVAIDAIIRPENAGGLAYYAALGFRDDPLDGDAVRKTLRLAPPP